MTLKEIGSGFSRDNTAVIYHVDKAEMAMGLREMTRGI
jgi:hypothetical protein